MTAKVIRILEHDADGDEAKSEADTPTAGWDPYEVWRTRVLLPRLEESQSEPNPPEKPGRRPVLERLRRVRRKD